MEAASSNPQARHEAQEAGTLKELTKNEVELREAARYVSPDANTDILDEAARVLAREGWTLELLASAGAVTGQLTCGFAVQEAMKRLKRRQR